jgi:glycosyltransferase involved in cell wall biosynthesis
LPVISAFQGDIKRIIEDKEIGFYYPPNDVNALSDIILSLYENEVVKNKMSEKAVTVFSEMFNSNKIYEEYADHVENIAGGCNGR